MLWASQPEGAPPVAMVVCTDSFRPFATGPGQAGSPLRHGHRANHRDPVRHPATTFHPHSDTGLPRPAKMGSSKMGIDTVSQL